MNKLFYVLIPMAMLASCGSKEEKTTEETPAADSTATGLYKAGDAITEDGALTNQEFLEAINGKDSLEVKLSAKINSVCKVKGCWMKLDLGSAKELMVKFKDYSFFVPKDCGGKTATIQGMVKVETVSVEDQKHYAKDDGQSDEEIAKITEPKTELTFVANGVLIK